MPNGQDAGTLAICTAVRRCTTKCPDHKAVPGELKLADLLAREIANHDSQVVVL